jgi:cardiolipin synthase A/B
MGVALGTTSPRSLASSLRHRTHMTVLKRAGLIVLALIVIMLLTIAVLSMTRGTPVHSVLVPGTMGLPPAVSDPLYSRTLELFAKTHLESGNRVQILRNGNESYPPLWRDLKSASRTITLQMYYAMPGALADTLAAILAERARAKVRVMVVLDAFGASPIKEEWVESLRAAGVNVRWLRPLHWYSLDKAGNRSHVRAVVVDGRIGYTGGFGIADKWQGNGLASDQWRDTNARFEGPVVMQLQAAFMAAWAEATGELLTGELFFPRPGFDSVGPATAGLLYTTPSVGSTDAERFLALSIVSARKTLYITNSYFVPDNDFRRMLTESAKRGVDVRVLTAGDQTDVKTTTYASRARYEELLRGGVRIYEYQPVMVHAKTFVVDGLWSSIGTLNFDNRSLALNNESNLVMLDAPLGNAMTAMFFSDLEHAVEIKLETFTRRPFTERMLEKGANLLSRLL